jgi:hypothetical protein
MTCRIDPWTSLYWRPTYCPSPASSSRNHHDTPSQLRCMLMCRTLPPPGGPPPPSRLPKEFILHVRGITGATVHTVLHRRVLTAINGHHSSETHIVCRRCSCSGRCLCGLAPHLMAWKRSASMIGVDALEFCVSDDGRLRVRVGRRVGSSSE